LEQRERRGLKLTWIGKALGLIESSLELCDDLVHEFDVRFIGCGWKSKGRSDSSEGKLSKEDESRSDVPSNVATVSPFTLVGGSLMSSMNGNGTKWNPGGLS